MTEVDLYGEDCRLSPIAGRFDENRIAAITHDLAVAIDAAALGLRPWDDVPALLGEAFPGSWTGLANMNFPQTRLDFVAFRNVDPAFARSYAAHFGAINPWNSYWSAIRGFAVGASEDVYPARQFRNSEFYNDWLMPQDRAIAAAGMKVMGDHHATVNVLLHYPLTLSPSYDQTAVRILRNLRGNFERAIRSASLLRADFDMAIARTALVDRAHSAAFVVDGERRIVDANPLAYTHLSRGEAISCKRDRFHLTDTRIDALLGETLDHMCLGRPTSVSHLSFRTAAKVWQVSFMGLPSAQPQPLSRLALIRPRQLVLVLLEELGSDTSQDRGLEPLVSVFNLTRAEVALCRHLLKGCSVSEAAEFLSITDGTARTRLKAIFHKTGTTRQSQLIYLLSQIR